MKQIRFISYILCSLLLCLGAAAGQQQQPPQPDPFAGALFPPELLMQHQQALGLTEEQKASIKAELRKSQTQMNELQWGLLDEVEKLAALVKQDQSDESRVLAQLDKVLAQEREIKRAHVGMLIRMKNSLTPEQVARLRKIVGQTMGG